MERCKISDAVASTETLEVLDDIFGNMERPDKVKIGLDPVTKNITIVYEDADDSWYKEVFDSLFYAGNINDGKVKIYKYKEEKKMKKFNETETCPKCSSKRFVEIGDKTDCFSRTYVEKSWEESKETPEHLSVKCSCCGFCFDEKCADA